jgi:hypothetical protein
MHKAFAEPPCRPLTSSVEAREEAEPHKEARWREIDVDTPIGRRGAAGFQHRGVPPL